MHLPKIGKRHESAIRREVLNDPLRILTAKHCLIVRRVHNLRSHLSSPRVRDRSCAVVVGVGDDGHGDDVAGLNAEVVEVDERVGEPFVPAVVGGAAVGVGEEVATRLQDGIAVCVAVDADPG